jgi:hypothetical protein
MRNPRAGLQRPPDKYPKDDQIFGTREEKVWKALIFQVSPSFFPHPSKLVRILVHGRAMGVMLYKSLLPQQFTLME